MPQNSNVGRLHEGRVVIVTGAAIGNGQAFAAEFARQGAQVVIADISDSKETLDIVRSIDGAPEPLALTVDVTDESSTRQMAQDVKAQFGRRCADAPLSRTFVEYCLLTDSIWSIFPGQARG